ncbi:MAG TPA: hypothetical protein VIK65_02585 [Candidatus Limnocylindrales bacterium]
MTDPVLDGGDDELSTVATIVGTVELDRALREHGQNAAAAAGAIADPHLGAAVVVVDAGGARLALAEPTTEGRLAASLARHDEGPLGEYVALRPGDTLAAYRRRAAASGVAVSGVEPGPFGPSVLVLARPATGPHLIVVEARSIPSVR